MSRLNVLTEIKATLNKLSTVPISRVSSFYKTGAGEYAEHDKFIGVRVPDLRKIAKKYNDLTLNEIQVFIESPINEERLLALLILINQYVKSGVDVKEELYQYYMKNIKHINNWNLVDTSAHLIIGATLLEKNKDILISLAKSKNMWERRISIVSTWYFIKNNKVIWTFKIAEVLLRDKEDLIHKAVGWMLREAGKHDKDMLIKFLDKHLFEMPRTMLRYSIERFPENLRKEYLKK